MKSLPFFEAASVFPNYMYFFSTKTSVFDRHTEELVLVLVLLIVGGENILVEQHQFRVIRAGFRELGEFLSDGSDQAGLSLHAVVIGHGGMRITDSEFLRVPRAWHIPRRHSQRD